MKNCKIISPSRCLVKAFVLLYVIQLHSLFAIGQIDSVSKSVLYSIIREAQPKDQIVYTDKLNEGILQGLKKYLGGRKIKGQNSDLKTIYIKLDRKDRAIIRTKLSSFQALVWEEGLFPNSERIPADSMWAYLHNSIREISTQVRSAIDKGDTAMVRKLNMTFAFKKNVFTFAPPIFIKHGEIALILYVRMCGPECGIDALDAYRLENGRYQKWLIITGGYY